MPCGERLYFRRLSGSLATPLNGLVSSFTSMENRED